MAISIGKTMQRLAADGVFGKSDLKKSVETLLDGRGVSRTEAQQFDRAFKKIDEAGTRITSQARTAKNAISRRLQTQTGRDEFSKDTLNAILKRTVVSSGGRSSGGEYGGSRRTSGGE